MNAGTITWIILGVILLGFAFIVFPFRSLPVILFIAWFLRIFWANYEVNHRGTG